MTLIRGLTEIPRADIKQVPDLMVLQSGDASSMTKPLSNIFTGIWASQTKHHTFKKSDAVYQKLKHIQGTVLGSKWLRVIWII